MIKQATFCNICNIYCVREKETSWYFDSFRGHLPNPSFHVTIGTTNSTPVWRTKNRQSNLLDAIIVSHLTICVADLRDDKGT